MISWLKQFDDMKAHHELVIRNWFVKDQENLERHFQNIAQDIDIIRKEKGCLNKEIMQNVIKSANGFRTQIDEKESKVSINSNRWGHLLRCPLSLDFIEDPVIMKGHTYDRKHLCSLSSVQGSISLHLVVTVAIQEFLIEEKDEVAYKRYANSLFLKRIRRRGVGS